MIVKFPITAIFTMMVVSISWYAAAMGGTTGYPHAE
jgi:hypothetical protein